MYEAVYGRGIMHPLRTEVAWLADRIHDGFRRGDLVLTPSDWQRTIIGGGGSRKESTQPEEEVKPAPEPAKADDMVWFRARLRDEDGISMAGEDYVLVDSTGARREGKLDANGEVYIPRILPPGDCTISFPKIHLNPRKRK